MTASVRPIPLKTAEHRPSRLSYCAGTCKMARVALYGTAPGGELSTEHGFEAVAEFESYDAAAAAVRAADATIAAFWGRP